MIIYFESTAKELSAADQEILADVLSRLSSVNAEGIHMVCFPPIVRQWLSNEGSELDLRKKERARIDAIASEYPVRYSLFKKAIVSLTVNTSLIGLTEEISGKYAIGYAAFLNGNWHLEPNLLVENIDLDGQFYTHLLHEMRRKNKIPNINFRLSHGGGASIDQVFNNIVSRKEIAIALIDSDRKSPISECSVTEKRLRKTKEMLKSSISDVLALPCMDIENLLPPNLIKDHNVCPDYSEEEYDVLHQLYMTGFPNNREEIPYAFFDVKMGIHRDKLLRIKNTRERQWIENNILSLANVQFEKISGLGENILSAVLARGDVMENFINYMSTDYWCNVFDKFFERVLYFLVADRKMVTR